MILYNINSSCQMQLDWALPKKKQSPLAISFSPEAENLSQNFVNPFLGYPTCPIIGRYNRGEYRIGQTLFHLEFKCKFNHKKQCYECGGRSVNIPEHMLKNIRNIPEVITNNKAAGIKNSPEVLPEKYEVKDEVSVIWIVSFGELGKDFLNYLNHMYVLAPYLFAEEKLKRQIHFLPIYAYLPLNSGLNEFEVDRGLNYQNYRGQYMSFHLAKGAPAFSPNNMRLSILGGKVITSKQPQKQEKKQKPKKKWISKEEYQQAKKKEKQKQLEMKEEEAENKENKEEVADKNVEQKEEKEEKMEDENKEQKQKKENANGSEWDELENPFPMEMEPEPQQKVKKQFTQEEKEQKKKNKGNNKPKEPKLDHQGYIHFYTSVLLQNDYRIYYHWHIEDKFKQDLIKQVWSQSSCVEDFTSKYQNFSGKDPLSLEVNNLLFPKEG